MYNEQIKNELKTICKNTNTTINLLLENIQSIKTLEKLLLINENEYNEYLKQHNKLKNEIIIYNEYITKLIDSKLKIINK